MPEQKVITVGDIVYETYSSGKRGVVVAIRQPLGRFTSYTVAREDGSHFVSESVAPYRAIVDKFEAKAAEHRERMARLTEARERILAQW